MTHRPAPTPPAKPTTHRRLRRALGPVCVALALGAAAPLASGSHSAHAAPAPGRPPGGPAIQSNDAPTPQPAEAAPVAPGVVVVGYDPSASPATRSSAARAVGATGSSGTAEAQAEGTPEASAEGSSAEAQAQVPAPAAQAQASSAEAQAEGAPPQLLTLAAHVSVPRAVARLRHTRGVAWAVPDYLAHVAGPLGPSTPPPTAGASAVGSDTSPTALTASLAALTASPTALTAAAASPTASTATAGGEPFPDDPGLTGAPGGWRELQWNFVGTFGVEAPGAWANLIADHAPGGRGVIVAVLDTGVAYANRGPFRRSPDFYRYQFVKGHDFVAHDAYPFDRNGHGTFVAGTVAEATNNGKDLTGLAYGVRLMPVRVLNSEGNGDAATIAQGVRFAVNHGARVINLSLEFPGGITAADIPELISALRYANRHGVVVVAAAGNEAHAAAAYPARAPNVIAVGATTEHGCLASYSNFGLGVTLVAPGGGPDASLPGDPNCHPELPAGRDVFQVTFTGTSPRRFGIPGGYEGTSMATPHVAAAAALVIASGVLGRHPTPAQVAARLVATARPLGGPTDSRLYGAGLLDAAAATAPGGPGAVP
jgi:serine protease